MTSAHSFADLCKEDVTPIDLGEGSLDLDTPVKEPLAYPVLTPIRDSIDGFRDINWKQVGQQARAGLNNTGVVIAVLAEKVHQLGCWMAEV
jgi:hypothetical protein